jgi:hypothetical protein
VSERALPPLRTALVAAFALLLLVSTALKLPPTWDWLSSQHAASARLSDADRARAPGLKALLPVSVFDYFRDHLRSSDRVYVQVGGPPQGAFFQGVSREEALREFARFYLLPAVVVGDPKHADVVLSIGADPRSLGLAYSGVVKYPGGRYYVARVHA